MKSKHYSYLLVSPYLQCCRRVQIPHILSGGEKIKPQPWHVHTLFLPVRLFRVFLQASGVINTPLPHNAPVKGEEICQLSAHFLLVCLRGHFLIKQIRVPLYKWMLCKVIRSSMAQLLRLNPTEIPAWVRDLCSTLVSEVALLHRSRLRMRTESLLPIIPASCTVLGLAARRRGRVLIGQRMSP